jgi:hypothetical protein
MCSNKDVKSVVNIIKTLALVYAKLSLLTYGQGVKYMSSKTNL